jgi:hypothetical protein
MKSLHINVFVVPIFTMVATTAAISDTEPPKAIYSAKQLRAGLLATAAKIKSLSVVYQSDDYSSGEFPMGTYLHREVIARAPCSLRHVSAHGHAALDWRNDPFQQSAYVIDHHVFNEFPVNRAYFESQVEPADGLPGTLQDEFFFLATGIWPLDRRAAPRPLGGPYMLRDVAEGEEFSAVRPRQEMVDGRWCHVLEWPGKDRLWLDTERGFILLRRDTTYGTRNALGQRLELGGHSEAAPGIWLPRRIQNMQFDYEAPTEEGRQRKIINAQHDVLRADVNPVDDSAFVFQPRPGSLLYKEGRRPMQAQAGGMDHLGYLVRWLQVHAPASWPRRAHSAIPFGSIAFLPTLVVIAACELRRRRAAKPPLVTGPPP